VYTLIQLATVEKKLIRKADVHHRLTYPQVAAHAFPREDGKTNYHRLFVYALVVLAVLGVAMAYVIFILETLPEIITALHTVSSTWRRFLSLEEPSFSSPSIVAQDMTQFAPHES
jgi:hypothetical protein